VRVMVTGNLGFIGSALTRRLLSQDYHVVGVDLMTYAADRRNLNEVWAHNMSRYQFCRLDVASGLAVLDAVDRFKPDVIVHCAAESHVDHSIVDGGPFISTNVAGTFNVLEAARRRGCRMVYVSTDEVYGDIPRGVRPCREDDPPSPSNTYAAAKMSGDLMCMAYRRTYGVDVAITRSSNNYGPYQYPEKLIPKAITYGMEGRRFPLHGDGRNVREWIHVDDNTRAIEKVMLDGGCEVYNIGTGYGLSNEDVVDLVNDQLGLPAGHFDRVGDRPGNDRRYAIDCGKIAKLGWRPEIRFGTGLTSTVEWYRDNRWWWEDKVVPDDWQIVPGEGQRG